MTRGIKSDVGSENTNTEGYVSVKTPTGWMLKHHIVAEEKIGRKLKPGERVYFGDGDRTNFDPDNVKIAIKGASSISRRVEVIKAKIAELMEELEDLLAAEKARQKPGSKSA